MVGGISSVAGASGSLAVGEVHTAIGHDRAGIAPADGRAPANGRPIRRELLDDAGFAPDSVTRRAEPLRPVVGEQRVAEQKRSAERAPSKAPDHVHGSRLHDQPAFGDLKAGKSG